MFSVPSKVGAYYESPDQAVAPAVLVTLAHGLGKAPKFAAMVLVNQIADAGYAPGDITLPITSTGSYGAGVYWDAINVNVRVGGSGAMVSHKTTGMATGITLANWTLRLRALA